MICTCFACNTSIGVGLQVCLLGRTPPRQVRVADRDGHMDYQDEDDDDDAITDNIRESIIDYLSCLTPHAQVVHSFCAYYRIARNVGGVKLWRINRNITLAKKILANNLLWRSSRNEW